MRKLSLLLLLLATPVFAQNTVTGTITDSNSNAYANGTVSAIGTSAFGLPGGAVVNGTTNSSGAFSISLPNGNFIFTVCATPTLLGVPTVNNTPTQTCFSNGTPISITGSGDISSTLNAYAKVLGPKSGGGSPVGNTGQPQCVGSPTTSFAACALGPQVAWYFSPNCGVAVGSVVNQCGEANADTQQDNTCSWASTGPTVTCTDGPFVSSDAGKQVMGWNTCAAFTSDSVMGAGAITLTGAPTISTFVSATQVTLSGNPSNTSGSNACFIWGTPDDTAAANLETAYDTAKSCPHVIMSGGYYMFTQPHFFSTPASCATTGLSFGNVNPGFGNVFYAGGFDLEGRGVAATQIFLMPNFPNGDACNRGVTTTACFVIPTMGRWIDFSITGGSNALATPLQNHTLVYAAVSSIDNVTCYNMGAFDTTTSITGFYFGWQVQPYQWNNSGCGSIGLQVASGQGAITCVKCAIENSRAIDVAVQGAPGDPAEGSFTCWDCRFINSQAANTTSIGGAIDILNKGGAINLFHTKLSDGGISQSAAATAYSCTTTTGCVLRIENSALAMTTANAGDVGLSCSVACTNYIANTTLTSGGSGHTIADGSSSSLTYDEGGNALGSTMSITGEFVPTHTGFASSGKQLQISGCSATASSATVISGYYVSGTTGTCTPTITMGNGYAAANGWSCVLHDLTTPADSQNQTASTTTTVTFSGTTVNGDHVNFSCAPY